MPIVAPLQFPGLKNGSRPFVAVNAKVGAKIYPQGSSGFPDLDVDIDRSVNAVELDWNAKTTAASIVNFSWEKVLGQPSGTWTLIVKDKWDEEGKKKRIEFGQFGVMDGDWIDLVFLRNGIRIPICRGVVDSVRESRVAVGGATAKTWTLTGRDHGSMFEYPITWSNLHVQSLNQLVKGLFTERVKGSVGGTPDETFRILIEATFKAGTYSGQWNIPKALADNVVGKRFYDILQVAPFRASKGGDEHLRGTYRNELQLWTSGGQTLHQTLMQWCNPLLNEIYYDLIMPPAFVPAGHGLASWWAAFDKGEALNPNEISVQDTAATYAEPANPLTGTTQEEQFGKIAAFIRERPFPNTIGADSSLWFDLPTWILPTWLLQVVDLGRAGYQRYNLFNLLADFGMGTQPEQQAMAKPRWNRDDIANRGLRIYEQTTKYYAENPADWMKARSDWQQLLTDWFGPSPIYRQGSITVKVPLPEVRVGQRLILDPGDEQRREQFYVEGVKIQYNGPTQNAGAVSSTAFTLTHGYVGADIDLLSMVNQVSGAGVGRSPRFRYSSVRAGSGMRTRTSRAQRRRTWTVNRSRARGRELRRPRRWTAITFW
jgi:hypothetical protein